jgi:hypothetical protein
MHRFRMPPQVVRLVLLTIGIVGSYLIARFFLTPASFGELGWYRADALQLLRDRNPVYAGKPACEECHPDEYQKLAKAEHKSLSCEGCHGPGYDHAANPDLTKMEIITFSHCVRCHGADPSRPKWHKQIDLKAHYAGQVCTECHVPHQPNEVP